MVWAGLGRGYGTDMYSEYALLAALGGTYPCSLSVHATGTCRGVLPSLGNKVPNSNISRTDKALSLRPNFEIPPNQVKYPCGPLPREMFTNL